MPEAQIYQVCHQKILLNSQLIGLNTHSPTVQQSNANAVSTQQFNKNHEESGTTNPAINLEHTSYSSTVQRERSKHSTVQQRSRNPIPTTNPERTSPTTLLIPRIDPTDACCHGNFVIRPQSPQFHLCITGILAGNGHFFMHIKRAHGTVFDFLNYLTV